MSHRLVLQGLALALLSASLLPATDYTVSALRGSDTNPGTFALPFKTLTKALGVAGNGDRVFVLPGRYSPSLGETFPLKIPAGVRVLGTDKRNCVIDAEYDPGLPNPKNPSSNPVQGTMVQMSARSELAEMSVVNGPRNPAKPGDYWWTVAVHIHDTSAGIDDARLHHCIIDQVSRGVFVGWATGQNNFKNVQVDNCVVTRFYVEGINATSNGTSSNNRILNCTVVGHINPTNNKPYGRACMSFGPNTQFDVRNSICRDADWAGIEASQGRISSDYNCLYGRAGGFLAFRGGIAKGANDIEVDPGLAALPTDSVTVDPHQAGVNGPLWNKGTNILTTGPDIDLNGKRLALGTVDIGADEFDGTDCWFVGAPRINQTFHVGAVGSRNAPMILVMALATLRAPVPIPGFGGRLQLDLGQPNIPLRVMTNAAGMARVPLPVPNDPLLVNFPIYLQSLDAASTTLSDLDELRFIR